MVYARQNIYFVVDVLDGLQRLQVENVSLIYSEKHRQGQRSAIVKAVLTIEHRIGMAGWEKIFESRRNWHVNGPITHQGSHRDEQQADRLTMSQDICAEIRA